MNKNQRLLLGGFLLFAVFFTTTVWGGISGKRLSGVVNLNTAGAEQLMLLPGIGSAKAEAIVTYRTAHPLTAIEELKEVKGIGSVLLERMKPYLSIAGETTLHVVSVSEEARVSDPRVGDPTPQNP